jgi:hypothetical protein
MSGSWSTICIRCRIIASRLSAFVLTPNSLTVCFRETVCLVFPSVRTATFSFLR